VAEEASSLCVPLCADQFQLAEFGGALVSRIDREAIRRGSFVSVPELKQAIEAFMQAWNESPKPFIWRATVEDIIKKIDRARVKMEQIKPGSTQPGGKEDGCSVKL